MSGHTPGPWFVGSTLAPLHGEGVPAIIGDGDSVVALMPGNWNFCTLKPDDARLIAAAPELLAVALHWQDLLNRYEINRVDGEYLSDAALALINAAIAKATQA